MVDSTKKIWVVCAALAGALSQGALGCQPPGARPEADGQPTRREANADAAAGAPPAPRAPEGTVLGPRFKDEQEILSALYQISQRQREAAALAVARAGAPEVRALGRQIARDSEEDSRQVVAYAQAHEIALRRVDDPTAFMLDERQIEELRNLRGTPFDDRFTSLMVLSNQRVLDIVRTARVRLENGELAALLDRLEATADRHRSTAQELLRRQDTTGGP